MGGVLGLDWSQIHSKIQLIESKSDTKYSIEEIEGIEIMEMESMRVINEDAK